MTAAIRIVLACLAVLPAPGVRAEPLPPGFVRLAEVAPGIRQDMRYARRFNFTGRAVPGYDAPQCILLRPVAMALKQAQARLEAEGFALKVYDCYRPVSAVQAFASWSRGPGDDAMKAVFFPGLDKSMLFNLGYLSPHSRHSNGTTVDIGLVRRDEEDLVPETGGRCDGPFEERARESTLDMGTAYDCLSPRSATASVEVSVSARENRERLRNALEQAGFRNYAREWWHFEFVAGPVPAEARDFPVR
jgi:D-alanyl-D-alanine dipeptidase